MPMPHRLVRFYWRNEFPFRKTSLASLRLCGEIRQPQPFGAT